MSEEFSKQIRSKATSDGNIELSIAKVEKPVPGDDEVLIEVKASPINPSDLGLLLSFAADVKNINITGSGDETVATMPVHPALMGSLKPRLDKSMPVGNEGAGVIVDAGIGTASDATIAMELGCDGVLVNSAIAKAKNPILMANSFKNAVLSGRESFLAGRMKKDYFGSPSSPSKGII